MIAIALLSGSIMRVTNQTRAAIDLSNPMASNLHELQRTLVCSTILSEVSGGMRDHGVVRMRLANLIANLMAYNWHSCMSDSDVITFQM